MLICNFCGAEIEEDEEPVDTAHSMFNLIGRTLNQPLVCSRCWKHTYYLLNESENIPVRYGSVSYKAGFNQACTEQKEVLSKLVVYDIDVNI